MILLYPISLLFQLALRVRDWMYAIGLFKQTSFSVPIVGVGNLSLGGSGKTPHVEYLARLLGDHLRLASLSRGYGRKSNGFKWVNPDSGVREVGDEPLQIRRKFDFPVAVCESRVDGVIKVMADHPAIQTILLDDSFQHLRIKPYINLLLTEYNRPFVEDHVLPAGSLRDLRSSAMRADAIIVTKCPANLSKEDMDSMAKRLRPASHQKVFFSTLEYGAPYHCFFPDQKIELAEMNHILLFLGVAKPSYITNWVEPQCESLRLLKYPDHHHFTKEDIGNMRLGYEEIKDKGGIVLTTEKDFARMDEHHEFLKEEKLPLYILPVAVKFLDNGHSFDDYVRERLLEFMV